MRRFKIMDVLSREFLRSNSLNDLLVIPNILHLDIKRSGHDDKTTGHVWLQKIYDRVFGLAFFGFVQTYVISSVACQTKNVPTSVESGLPQAVPPPSTAF